MNDIERYNFWHSEQDAFVKKVQEDTIRIIDESIGELKLTKNAFDFVMGVDERIANRNKKGA